MWSLRQEMVDEWQESFPTIDVMAECLKAHAWVKANMGRRKTAGGMPRFFVSWFTRATSDKQHSASSSRTQSTPRSSFVRDQSKPDWRGHIPPCSNTEDCNKKYQAEKKAKVSA